MPALVPNALASLSNGLSKHQSTASILARHAFSSSILQAAVLPRGGAWHDLPHMSRYCVSGCLGSVVLYICEKISSTVYQHDTFTFFVAYILHVPFQHLLHAALVYGIDTIDTIPKYFHTLLGMYSALMTSAVGSTVLNAYILRNYNVSKMTAIVTTLCIFSAFNYYVIGWIVSHTRIDAVSETVDLTMADPTKDMNDHSKQQ